MSIKDQINSIFSRLIPTPKKKAINEIVAVDLDSRGVVCVKMKKLAGGLSVLAAEILPSSGTGEKNKSGDSKTSFTLPRHLVSRHAAICLPGEDAIVKLLSFPGGLNEEVEQQIKILMGIEEGDFRIAHKLLSQQHGRASETKLLTIAFPSSEVAAALDLFPVGIPAPISIEVAELASLTAFLHGPAARFTDTAVGAIKIGTRSAFLAFFNKGQLSLLRKFDFGFHHILDAVQKGLGVDSETAMDIITDGSFDISLLIKNLSDPFVKQLMISKHFVERREDCAVQALFVPEGMPRDWLNDVNSAMAIEAQTWSPFEGLDVVSGALSTEYEKMPSRFSAAIGAGLGVFEEVSA